MARLSQKHADLQRFIRRGLEGFQTRVAVELQSCGVSELDALLGGGFPRGSLVELCGPSSSGRTSLAYALLAQATDRQEACAFVDVSDSLDPVSLAAGGVDLQRLLWIRCGETEGQGPDVDASPFFSSSEREAGDARVNKKPAPVHGWRHPRELIRGVDEAIPSMLGRQRSSAESAQIHLVARCAGEQVERDREPPRRGIRAPRPLPAMRDSAPTPSQRFGSRNGKPWKRLEQALKSTDLLLHGGGWGVVVVDLGGVSWVDAGRINLNIWFRFRRAIENTPTILLLLGEESCARSCASLVLRCQRRTDTWNRAVVDLPNSPATFEGFEVQGEVSRSRVLSQSADFARWQAHTP
jgi:recombination protein RecA